MIHWMDLVISLGHIGERIRVEWLGYYRVGKRIVVAENVGYPLGKLGIKREKKKIFSVSNILSKILKQRVS